MHAVAVVKRAAAVSGPPAGPNPMTPRARMRQLGGAHATGLAKSDTSDGRTALLAPSEPKSSAADAPSAAAPGLCDPCFPIVYPHEVWKERWDLVIMVLIMYSAVTVPLRVCFSADAQGQVWAFEVAMSFCFLFDLSVTFRLAYQDVQGAWVTDRGAIASNYFQGWFWIDAPSSLPVEVIELLLPHGADTSNLAFLRALRVFRLIRLLRLLKLEALIGRLEEFLDMNLRVIKILFLVIKMFFVAHLLACGWFYVAALESDLAAAVPNDGSSWVADYDDGSGLQGDVGRQYLFALYWAFTTLTTVGCTHAGA